ncbi:MAG: hypothetical protein EPO07_15955 [Verrucomicrobia bacterium]|nr:MAG: hypothetical protein EPO07_15955 [Verrucomicrobiota bacterium]
MENESQNQTSPETAPPPPTAETNWLVFFAVLLAPVILSCIAGALDKPNGGLSPMIALIGGGVAGIICGIMLGLRFGKTTGQKSVLIVGLAIVMVIVCIGLNCFGCLASGYQMSFR